MTDLTPEEKQRIYLEEKARIEAQDRVRQEQAHATVKAAQLKASADKDRKSNRRLGYGVMLAALVIVLWAASRHDGDRSAPPTTSVQPSTVDEKAAANLAQCKDRLGKAQELGVLYDMKARGASIQILVGPTWYSIPLDAKEGFNDTVQCVLLKGKGGAITSVEYLDYRTGKTVAKIGFSGGLKITE